MFKIKKTKILCSVLALLLIISSIAYAEPVHKDIFGEVSSDNIYRHIEVLASEDDARVTGTEGERNAADYIYEQMENSGLEVEEQEFPILTYIDNGAELVMSSPEDKEFKTQTMQFSPATPEEGITAEVVYCGTGAEDSDFPEDVDGKIALIKRGGITFFEKAQNAAAKGAVGAIIFNREDGLINGTLGEPSDIPAIDLSGEDGNYIVGLLEDGENVTVTMKVDAEIKESTSQNIIGTLKADRGNKSEGTIVMGAHYDCVDTPGANDNASGVATMLEAARILSSQKLAYDIKFIAFGAEEIGLVGSYEYVASLSDEEFQNTVAMINMDMVAVGDRIGVITEFEEDSFVVDLAETYLKEFGYEYDRDYTDASDHAPFEESGIPSVFFDYHDDPYYHTDEDSLDKIQKDSLYDMCTLVTAMTYDMAKTPMPKSENGLKAKVNKYRSVNREIPEE